jgi:hypothetical protein
MATIGTSHVEGPAMRLHMEQLEKRVRLEAERDRAIAEGAERQRRIRMTRHANDTVVLVDHPTMEGR